MIRVSSDAWCLGLWRRLESFPVDFLDDLVGVCRTTGLGFIGLTPWRSLVVSGIRNRDRRDWERLLTTYGWNTRHASQELGWIVPDARSLPLKSHLCRTLARRDVRTFGKTFSLDRTERHTSVCLERARSRWPFWNVYQATSGAGDYLKTGSWIPSFRLGAALAKRLSPRSQSSPPRSAPVATAVLPVCPSCGYRYHEEWGDVLGGVVPGTPFSHLPADWMCPVCDTQASEFQSAAGSSN